jgi:hypothetical protein
VAGLEERVFAGEGEGQRIERDQAAALGRYEWLDRHERRVRVPIDLAIDELVAGEVSR